MKCSNCGKAERVADVRDMPYVYKGEPTVFDAATSRAISAEMKAFGKQ